jgi:hypothetical protein
VKKISKTFKNNFVSKFFSVISLITGSLLSLNSVFYPNLTVKYFKINSLTILLIFFVISLLLLLFTKIKPISEKLSRINNKIFLPFLLTTNALFIFLEKTQYPNYVLKHFHIFPFSFIYILILSLMIFYISKFRFRESMEKNAKILFLIIFSVFCYLWIDHNNFFVWITGEDSVLEYLQFMFYLFSGFISYKIFLLLKKKKRFFSLLFLIFSIVLFFISLEEISYGQRIFGFTTPEQIKEINLQEETNIHNIFGYEINQIAYIIIGFYGLFSRRIVTKFFPKKGKDLIIFTPPIYLSWYFLLVFLVYYDRNFLNLNYDMVINNVFRKYAIWQWLEVSELYLAMAFFIYTLSTHKNLIGTGKDKI